MIKSSVFANILLQPKEKNQELKFVVEKITMCDCQF